MTLAEFKAWFEGFSEHIKLAPTEVQWKRIKARVSEIDSRATTYPIFVRDYWPSYPGITWSTDWNQPYSTLSCAGNDSGLGQANIETLHKGSIGYKEGNLNFDSSLAFRSLGQEEFKGVA